jgi:hypothetical protein
MIDEGMTRRSDLEATYHEYNVQIDSILSLADGNYRAAARIVAWFYGGSSESWRKFLARRKAKKSTPAEVKKLLMRIIGK